MSILVGGTYVQHMLPYGTSLYAFINLFLICNCFCSFFYIYIYIFFFKSGIEMPDRNGLWYQHLLILLAIFYKSNTEEANFRIMFIFYVYVMCMFWHVLYLYSTCARFELVKSPEVTLCS